MADLLERRLVDLGRALDVPTAPAGLAEAVGERIRTGGVGRARQWWSGVRYRPVRRSLLLAVGALLLVAAAVAAAGILLPGLRVVLLPPDATLPPVPTDRLVGARLGLGTATDVDDAAGILGFEPLVPADPAVGRPDEAYVAGDRLTLLWHPKPGLPRLDVGDVGLVVTELRGTVDGSYFEKVAIEGRTEVQPVQVGSLDGWWLSGAPHHLVYRRTDGTFVEETRRVVGDVLLWRRDGLTIRIESALGRDATIALAETFGPAR